jgi:hypothetical protein
MQVTEEQRRLLSELADDETSDLSVAEMAARAGTDVNTAIDVIASHFAVTGGTLLPRLGRIVERRRRMPRGVIRIRTWSLF